MRKHLSIFTALLFIFLISSNIHSRMAVDKSDLKRNNQGKSTAFPAREAADHQVGKLQLTVSNIGTFGDGFIGGTDPFTGRSVLGGIYPKGSGIRYVFAGAFWIGAVVGRDTLVSTGADGWSGDAGAEFSPDEAPWGKLVRRSLIDPSSTEFDGAVSEEDIIATYMDTLIDGVANDQILNRPHVPLNIKVVESSYAWSYSYAEDFVLFDYQITNFGFNTLREVYMGVYQDADVGTDAEGGSSDYWTDDICGFLHTMPDTLKTSFGDDCIYIDTVNIAWIADNDGELGSMNPAPHVTATRIVRTPSDKLEVSFNWWISNGDSQQDFGPRERNNVGQWKEEFRQFEHGGLGTSTGDRNKYYMLRNREFDYDQVFTANVRQNDSLWLFPNPSLSKTFSDGYDTRYLLSFGPFTIEPGQTLPITFAYLGGENLHYNSDNFKENLENSYNPVAYYSNLNFKDLATNARWASWVYDNPGVDTDDDGYLGEYVICCDSANTICDTNYITGDRVPDFAGAKPPPPPDFWITPSPGKIHIRFNGLRSETTPDEFLARFTNNKVKIDFEGYKIYLARDKRAASYSLVASYDIDNYKKYIWVQRTNRWENPEVPFTLDSLRLIYGDPENPQSFYPLDYTIINPLEYGDSLFYFVKQEDNTSQFGVNTKIKKRFPNEPYPPTLYPEEADDSILTEDGYFKYFEYELEIENLLPTVEYWVNVTALDYGSPQGLPPLQSSVTLGAKNFYAQVVLGTVTENSPKIYVYPNPYRFDGNYRDHGYEGRKEDDINRPDDRVRAINFVNVPPHCKIRIFSLDGDLVREFEHEKDPSDPTANHAEWNLITRNTQMTVSGLYYWTVENFDTGEVQIGKLVIIM